MLPYTEWRPSFKAALASLCDINPDGIFQGVNDESAMLSAFCFLFYDCRDQQEAEYLFRGAPRISAAFLNYAISADVMMERDASFRERLNFEIHPSHGPYQLVASVVQRMALPALQKNYGPTDQVSQVGVLEDKTCDKLESGEARETDDSQPVG